MGGLDSKGRAGREEARSRGVRVPKTAFLVAVRNCHLICFHHLTDFSFSSVFPFGIGRSDGTPLAGGDGREKHRPFPFNNFGRFGQPGLGSIRADRHGCALTPSNKRAMLAMDRSRGQANRREQQRSRGQLRQLTDERRSPQKEDSHGLLRATHRRIPRQRYKRTLVP
jgi:hypothetical protein